MGRRHPACPGWRLAGGLYLAAALAAKQTKNEQRTWSDWRNVPSDYAIEHVRVPTPGDTEATR